MGDGEGEASALIAMIIGLINVPRFGAGADVKIFSLQKILAYKPPWSRALPFRFQYLLKTPASFPSISTVSTIMGL